MSELTIEMIRKARETLHNAKVPRRHISVVMAVQSGIDLGLISLTEYVRFVLEELSTDFDLNHDCFKRGN